MRDAFLTLGIIGAWIGGCGFVYVAIRVLDRLLPSKDSDAE